jgi:hypothetical protein
MKFDPFSYKNLFYKYDLKISTNEINQILYLVKDVKTDEQKNTFQYLNVLNFPILKNLRQQIISILNSHELLLRNNWAQFYNKNDAHDVHIHSGSDYSGIIYIQGKSPTIFYDRSFGTYSYKFKKNKLLLFPSDIPHQVKKLDSNEERLIISFNTMKNKK